MNTVEELEIKTSKEKFFREYLTIKRPIINYILSKLNNRKVVLNDKLLFVLAELLYMADLYSDLPGNEMWFLVFGKNSKELIMKRLNMKEHYLNNYLSCLRRIKVITNGQINKLFLIPAISRDLNFKFTVNGEEHEQQMDEKNNS